LAGAKAGFSGVLVRQRVVWPITHGLENRAM
jgi:hypothetical protein